MASSVCPWASQVRSCLALLMCSSRTLLALAALLGSPHEDTLLVGSVLPLPVLPTYEVGSAALQIGRPRQDMLCAMS